MSPTLLLDTDTFLENVGEMHGWDAAKVARLKTLLSQRGGYPRATRDHLSQICTEFTEAEGPKPPDDLPDPDQ